MPPLENSRAKLARATEHFDALRDELRNQPDDGRFWKANPQPLRGEVEREGREHALYLSLSEEPDLVQWGIWLGDGMHNLRCALDHAVYDLAIRASGKDPPPMERQLQFPIADCPKKWTDSKWRIKPLRDDAERVICDAQPYNRPGELVTQPLRLLRELDDADKHRLIAPGLVGVQRGMFRITPPIVPMAYQLPDMSHGLENNTKIAWVLFAQPEPDVNVNFRVTLSVGVQHDATQQGDTWSMIGEVVAFAGAEVGRIIEELEALPV
ncbi:MAG: hypothetical protein ACRDNB_07935 [Gaiellaceae bacterium]